MKTLAKCDLDDVVVFYDSQYKKGTIAGIRFFDHRPTAYLIAWYEGQDQYPKAWTNPTCFFPNFILSNSITGFKFFYILEESELVL